MVLCATQANEHFEVLFRTLRNVSANETFSYGFFSKNICLFKIKVDFYHFD